MRRIKKFFKLLGPGFITGASDDDPSGIATYAQTGAIFGYSQLWAAIYTLPFMITIQEMSGRIGVITGKGLAGVIRHHYSKKLLYFTVTLLLVANIVNIGTDLGAMAASLQLIFNLPFILLLIVITLLTLLLEVFVSYRVYARYLKYLTLSLFAFIAVAFVLQQNWREIVFSSFVPNVSFSTDYLLNIVAILGTTISPYLFFWQAGEEVEEEVRAGKLRVMGQGIPKVTKTDLKILRKDTTIGMFFSNLVMFFIIITFAATFVNSGFAEIQTASQAAAVLEPIAGNFAFLIFALAIVGTGLLAVPILAGSASYALSETFGWKEGLYRKFTKAKGFYAVIAVAIIIGFLINFTPIPPFKMLYYTAVLNGLIAPPLLFLIVLIGNNKEIMGKYTNSTFANAFGLVLALIMSLASVALIVSFFI
jgi:NRAMP (natural resistance-associated macrophage protein)-like metal ion transporter